MAWVKVGSSYALSLSKGNIGVVVDLLGGATVKHHLAGERVRVLGQFSDEQQALTWAEEMVSKNFSADISLVSLGAAWRRRREPPTEKQLLWCGKMGVRVPDGATKSDVQIILSRAFAEHNGMGKRGGV